MSFKKFFVYSLLGGVLWGAGLPIAAFYIGKLIPDLDKYILLVIAVVIVISFIPIALELIKSRKNN
ncbi:MAG TPA: hypothetical protein ENK21_06510 [Trueperaceae bacterium]|nr:hypothetical protein [Trueperaceae bacterium]